MGDGRWKMVANLVPSNTRNHSVLKSTSIDIMVEIEMIGMVGFDSTILTKRIIIEIN
jgi:predicted ATP-grasp superfamily ATP-dependent carboligase